MAHRISRPRFLCVLMIIAALTLGVGIGINIDNFADGTSILTKPLHYEDWEAEQGSFHALGGNRFQLVPNRSSGTGWAEIRTDANTWDDGRYNWIEFEIWSPNPEEVLLEVESYSHARINTSFTVSNSWERLQEDPGSVIYLPEEGWQKVRVPLREADGIVTHEIKIRVFFAPVTIRNITLVP